MIMMIVMIKTGGKRRNIESREAARLRRRRGGSAPGGRLIYLDEERLRKNMIYYSNFYVIYFDAKRLRIKRIKHAGGNMLMSKKVQYLITGGEGGMERDAWIREEIQPCHRCPRKNVHFFVFPKDCFIILQ